jgi:asparagine synthase (glutamine-hydrolysing)
MWRIEFDRISESLAPTLAELGADRTANSAPRQGAGSDFLAIVADGSRWSATIRLLTGGDPREARRLLIVDAPFLQGDTPLAADTAIRTNVKVSGGKDVGGLARSLSQILGPEFAFALIDMDTRSLALVRDPIGARPLYWRRDGNAVAFSSAREHLVSVGPTPVIDDAAVAILAASGGEFDSWRKQELLAGFHRVPHGGYAVLSRETAKTGQWWDPPLSARGRGAPNRTETGRQVRSSLEQAIASRLGDTQSVAAHVSGGIDSTGVAAIGARRLTAAGRALAGAYAWSPALSEAIPDLGWRDERRRIGSFAAREHVPVRFGGATPEDFIAFLARPIELEGTGDLFDEMPILRMAQADGVQIMLSGWGGDEVFSSHGAGYLSHLLVTFQWDRAARWIRNNLLTLRKIGPLATFVWWQGIQPMLPDFLDRLFHPSRTTDPDRTLISPTLLRQHRDEVDEVRHAFRPNYRPNETMFRHFMVGHITHRIETWDVWSRQHGFRYSYPLTDWRLVETLLSLPPEQHFPGETSRGLALDALADALPQGVTKFDAANEACRTATRHGAWRILAEMERKGQFRHDCPWLDMKRFRERLANPIDQTTSAGVLAFADLFTAVRVWHMWTRAACLK